MKTFSITDIGLKRKINQDYVFSSEMQVGALPNLFIVADGMGGHKAGDYASRKATQIIVESIKSSEETSPVRLIRTAVERANKELLKKAKESEDYEGMGTTMVVATITEECLYVANVGDSRLYIINDEINQVTKDHSLVEEMVRMGGIDEETAKYHPKKNVITRAVGGAEEIEIDFFELKLMPGDIILMCSDGLTNMLDDEEIKLIIKKQRDVIEKAEELVKAANENGGRDNITVTIIEQSETEE
ncbi:MAG: Stp1/IreP family PP2C-type Ser/Thr phosphatase [Lachnospiraceae bacterium]|nr:Stp1/IreP family PP2C-type Ser/Thr phosphatase [Lachnospiraceae bacterium]